MSCRALLRLLVHDPDRYHAIISSDTNPAARPGPCVTVGVCSTASSVTDHGSCEARRLVSVKACECTVSHHIRRYAKGLLILLWASTSVWLAFFPVEHKRRCWRLTAPVAFHFHCISFNITTNVTSVIIHFHCGICRLLLCSRINEVTQIGKTWGVGVIYKFGGELSNACVAHQCVSSVGVTFKMLKRGCSYIYVTNSVSCQRSFWKCLYETWYLTRQHNSFLVDE